MSSEASAAASVADQVPALARQKLVFFSCWLTLKSFDKCCFVLAGLALNLRSVISLKGKSGWLTKMFLLLRCRRSKINSTNSFFITSEAELGQEFQFSSFFPALSWAPLKTPSSSSLVVPTETKPGRKLPN